MVVYPVLTVSPKILPVLDPEFQPAALWNRAYRQAVASAGGSKLALALERGGGAVSVFRTEVLPHHGANVPLNQRYLERLLKFLLWQKGGYRVTVGGDPEIARWLQEVYGPEGPRAFDYRFLGEQVYRRPLEIEAYVFDGVPAERETAALLGRHLDGYRIGFDLGASDRKCAAVADGKVIFSEEVPWDPSRQTDPQYHFNGINDSLRRAAAKLPRVDAIGGSAAGVYVGNEVRAGSLYRSVPQQSFETYIRPLFFELRKCWGGIPFEVVNDGEVTA
ncbi:MAG: ROK family protein, partial [Acidobacteriia bacterium]|nr:ROK family protein [Terriglobia bacterium]